MFAEHLYPTGDPDWSDDALAIGRAESGRLDPSTGRIDAWPWAVNVAGTSFFPVSLANAVDLVRTTQAGALRSIDVGCLQVNLLHHRDAFASLEQAFDPDTNARYAAGFLRTLFLRAGSWEAAAAAYHSGTPGVSASYRDRVMAAWREMDGAKGVDGAGKAGESWRFTEANRGSLLRDHLAEARSDQDLLVLRGMEGRAGARGRDPGRALRQAQH